MKTFELKEEHLKLLSRAYVGWDDCETGAPCIDPKRPYGNSDVAGDVAEILGIEFKSDTHGDRDDAQRDDLLDLHRETQTALQIVLSVGLVKPGTFQLMNKYDFTSWKQIGDAHVEQEPSSDVVEAVAKAVVNADIESFGGAWPWPEGDAPWAAKVKQDARDVARVAIKAYLKETSPRK